MTALYDIANEYRKAFEELSEIEDLDEQTIRDSLAHIEASMAEKCVAVQKVRLSLQGDVDAIDKEIKRLNGLKTAAKNKYERLGAYIRDEMIHSGNKTLDGKIFKFTLRNPSPSVLIEDESLVPDEWKEVKVTATVRKKDVLAALKAGEEVPGCKQHLGDPSLMVR